MKSARIFLFLLCSILFLVGCGRTETPATIAAKDGIFLLNTGAEPRDLDPHLVTGMPEHRVIKALLEGLVAEHPTQNGAVVPGVAERWESNGDASEWTFYLRSDARWSNGDPVTSADFLYAFRRILNPELAAPYASMLYLVKNAEAYNAGEVTDFESVGFRAPDPHTLEVSLIGPSPYFPSMLTHYTWFPVHQKTIEAVDGFASRGSGWTLPENYVGNGPFILTEWKPDQRIIAEKSSTYWDAENVSLQAIHFFPVSDRQTEERMFKTGQLHKTSGVPFTLRDKYRESGSTEFREDPFFATSYLGLNTLNGPLQDRRVRQAMSLAIDRGLIVDRVTKNGNPAEGFVPLGIPGYPYEKYIQHDPEAARKLLADAGYAGGEGFPEIDMIITSSDTSRTYAEVLQEMWRNELGINIRISNKEWQVLISDMDSGNFDIFLISWIGDYLDPATFLKIFKSGDGNNRTGFANPSYDQLIASANQQRLVGRRYAILEEAETLLMTEMPIIPLNWSNDMYLLDGRVTGWAPKLLMDQPYKSVKLVP